jgi:hypothetical protein
LKNASTGKWTAEEDAAQLIDAVKKCGKNWVAFAALGSRVEQADSAVTKSVAEEHDATDDEGLDWVY